MNAKTLYILIAAAVLALVVAMAINHANRPASDVAQQAQALAPALKDHVNDISAITLSGAGDKVLVTLKRDKDNWVLAERSDYPADVAKIREFLLKLTQATLIEQKTGNPAHYADLGVSDVKDKDAKGVLVDIAGLAQPLKVIIGNFNGSGGGGTFVRVDGDAQSWLASGNLTVAKNVTDWEKKDLVDIASNRVRSVTLTSRDGKVLKAFKDQATDSNFKIADVPKGRETSSDFAANSLGSVLSALKADDVVAAKDAAPQDKTIKAEYTAFDGIVIGVTGWDKDGKDYAQFAAHLDSAAANAEIEKAQAKAKSEYDSAVAAAAAKKPADEKTTAEGKAPESKEPTEVPKLLAVSNPDKDRQDKLDATNKEIETLNKTFSGWTFVLPSYKFSEMSKTMDDMLKPLETKKPDAKDPKAAPAKTLIPAPPKPAAH